MGHNDTIDYQLVCDVCGLAVSLDDGVVAWTASDRRESGHVLVHSACAPAGVTDRIGVRLLTSPAGFLEFVTDRFAREIVDPQRLASLVWALASFITRPDSGAEMNVLRAATFGMTFGVKPGEIKRQHQLGRVLQNASD